MLAPVAVDAGCAVVGCTFGVTAPPLSPAEPRHGRGLDTGALSLVAACVRLQRCDDSDTDALVAEARLFGARVDLRDDGAPAVERAGCRPTVSSSQQPTTVHASASDSGGGVAALALVVDGQEVHGETPAALRAALRAGGSVSCRGRRRPRARPVGSSRRARTRPRARGRRRRERRQRAPR